MLNKYWILLHEHHRYQFQSIQQLQVSCPLFLDPCLVITRRITRIAAFNQDGTLRENGWSTWKRPIAASAIRAKFSISRKTVNKCSLIGDTITGKWPSRKTTVWAFSLVIIASFSFVIILALIHHTLRPRSSRLDKLSSRITSNDLSYLYFRLW